MEQFPLTTAGVAGWQTWLYALDPEVIAQEADDAEYNFKAWVNDRFELSAGQAAYLDGLDETLTARWGENVAFFVLHRLPIELAKPEESPEAKSSKLILSEEELQTLQGQQRTSADGVAFTGVLRFSITY